MERTAANPDRERVSPPHLVPLERGAVLVPVLDGVADLEEALRLNDGALRAIELLEAGSERFTEALASWRSPSPATSPSSDSTPPLSPGDLETVARSVLAAGHRLMFRARGHSMRPLVPDGSRLHVGSATFDEVESGSVILYGARDHRLVAHRVVGRDGEHLLTRGDSSTRVDRVSRDRLLGLVEKRSLDHAGGETTVDLTTSASRRSGSLSNRFFALATLVVRAVTLPLRVSSSLRAIVRFPVRLVSSILLRLERLAFWMRRPLDVLRAALLSSHEKSEARRRLYESFSVREFTALSENLRAGLTLIEEVALQRHGLPRGRTLVIGCGPGREAIVLAGKGHDVTGIDLDPAMLEKARQETESRGLSVRYLQAEASDFDLGETFDTVLVFSGLLNMCLPSLRRVALLSCARRHIAPDGRVVVTFLSAYIPPGEVGASPAPARLKVVNPEHERGDTYLINETVHIYPRQEELVREAREAGLHVEHLFRDQRAYDRQHGQVRGYAVLVAAP